MPTFRYAARDWEGAEHTGAIEAPDERSARESLRRRELFVTRIEQEGGRGVMGSLAALLGTRRGRRAKPSDDGPRR